MFRTHDKRFPSCIISQGVVYSDSVKFGDNTIIGANTVIRDNVEIGDNTIIAPLCVIESGAKIGSNVTIQPFCVIARNTIIEDSVFIAPHFTCANDKHINIGEHGNSPNKQPFTEYPIRIKEFAVIGSGVAVAPGIEIGRCARIDMCCLITHNVPDNAHIRASGEIVGRVQ